MENLQQPQNRHNYRVFLGVCLLLLAISVPLSLTTNTSYSKELVRLNHSKAVNIIYFFSGSSKLSMAEDQRVLMALNNEKMILSLSRAPQYKNAITLHCHQGEFCNVNKRDIQHALHTVNFADPSPPVTFSVYIHPLKRWLNFSFGRMHYPFLSIFIAVIQLAIVFSILTYLVSLQRFSRAWRKIVVLSKQVGLNLQRTRKPFFGPTILKESISLMEAMVERIDQLIRERVATIAALSHDIRTPLTRVKFYAERIDNAELKQSVLKQVDEIQYLLEETLSYARQDYQDEPKRQLELISLVEAICDDMADVEQAVTFNTQRDNFIMQGQRVGLKRAISNLIENGIKYGDSVMVDILSKTDCVEIHIVDKGKGLPDDALKSVLEPFNRYTKNHDKKIKGTGLGLTIAKNIIENNKGNLLLKNHDKYGLNVVIIFKNKLTGEDNEA